jgi:hypothetical protein
MSMTQLHTVIEMPEFRSRARRRMSEFERLSLINYLAANPQAGEKMVGTGGARKVRWAIGGSGKSGGVRAITFYSGPDVPVFLLTVFGKGEKSNITRAEANALKVLLGDIVEAYKRTSKTKGTKR